MDKNMINGKKLLANIMETDLTTFYSRMGEGWFVICMNKQ